MRLIKFKVYRYRSIEDSGEIPVDDKITTFVGINESGKTNVLRALRKLNSLSDTKFNRLTENPVWHFRNFDLNEMFITATFSLNETERKAIEAIESAYADLTEISFSRNKNMDLICHFKEKDQLAIPFATFNSSYIQPLVALVERIDPAPIENGAAKKEQLSASLDAISTGFEDDLNIRKPKILSELKNRIKQFHTQLDTISNQHDNSEIVQLLEKIENEVKPDNGEEVKNYLIDRLPRFIYFENIGVIDSRINLQSLVADLKSNNLTDEELTAKTLLDLAELDPKDLLTLSSEEKKNQPKIIQDKDTLSQLCNQASLSVSRELDTIWRQNEHDVQIEVNGNYLRLWVVNRQDRLRLQLEERSRGYQWYFSFYVVFNVESEGRHKDSILLLDEPALFLHALGQDDFLKKALPELSEKNQIIYTTHSPFLLDLNRPYSIHTVTIKDKERRESIISKEHWASDRDALFPLQSAVGYHLAQSMFIGTRSMIVEGLTDFWILSSASALLEANGKTSLDKTFVFSPAGGGTKTVILAKTYVSQELKVGVLLDSDNEGNIAKEQLIRDQILKSNKILTLGDIFDQPNQTMSLEDIFPEDFYLKFVKMSYSKELGGKEIVLDSKNPMLVKRIEAFFTKNNVVGTFDKTKPALAITKEFGKTDLSTMPSQLVTNFEKLFSAINEIMK
jgi:predicted ATP-dependent endonuclease of OLD family